jgi:hypothetical protein
VGCEQGFTAECNGHLTALAIELVATRKVPAKRLPGCHSFDPDTRVVMADGTTKAIKDVKVGDKVLATDPATGKTHVRVVTHLHINQDTNLAEVTVRTSDGKLVTLSTTQNHPFWDATTGRWVNAADLQPGHNLRGVKGPGRPTVVAVRNHTGSEQMRDLTIATTHTYHVLAGNTPVLVRQPGIVM